MSHPMNISEAAQAAGLTAKMIRHYESLGLISEAFRTEAGYRQYSAREVTVLRFIRQSRSMGFSTKQIAQLLALWSDTGRESREVKELAGQHIAELDRKMQELAQMKAALQQIATDCHGDQRADCPIIDELSDRAAPIELKPAARPASKPHSAAHARTARSERQEHHGLVAWMHSVSRTSTAEHDRWS